MGGTIQETRLRLGAPDPDAQVKSRLPITSRLCHLGWLLTSVCFSFLICKMGFMIIVPIL